MRTWLYLVLVVATTAAMAHAGAPVLAVDEPRPTVMRPEEADTQRPDPLGVHLSSLYELGPRRRLAVLDRIEHAHASWIRIDISWASLEAEGDDIYAEWYLDRIDAVLRGAARRELEVLAMFWLTPAWANDGRGTRFLPARAADYADALGWAAERWGADIDAWEIWNEPNSADFLVDGTPRRYTRLLCAAYPAVKAADSSPVLSGGLQYNDAPWLRRVYKNNGKACFDAVATHPYVAPSDAPPETRHEHRIWRLTRTPLIRRVMRRHDDGAKQIWMTEIGWSTGRSPDPDPWERGVSRAVQADYLRRAVELVRSRYAYVGPIFWYRDIDGAHPRTFRDGFGLMTRGLRPKPALRAYREAADRRP